MTPEELQRQSGLRIHESLPPLEKARHKYVPKTTSDDDNYYQYEEEYRIQDGYFLG